MITPNLSSDYVELSADIKIEKHSKASGKASTTG